MPELISIVDGVAKVSIAATEPTDSVELNKTGGLPVGKSFATVELQSGNEFRVDQTDRRAAIWLSLLNERRETGESIYLEVEPETKVIQLKEIITSLAVENDIHVVLTETKSGEILVEGQVNALDIHVSDGQLQLAKKYEKLNAPLKVYVPATYLSKVYMNGTGSLSSSTVLTSPRIKVILSGESTIAIRSAGNVTVETMNDIQFVKSR